jgi:hypothetical protein
MTLEELDKLFEDPANRPWGVFYHCADDPRIIAPSRPTWGGWQINFAHPRAVSFLLFYLGVLIGPLLLAALLGPRDPLHMLLLAVGVFVPSVFCLNRLSCQQSRKHAD